MTYSAIRTAIVGAGFFGATLARACRDHETFDVVSVADLAPDAAARLADEVGARPAHPDEAAARTDVDLVVVATPNHVHAGPAIAALEQGKHVFVEKPLAITRADTAAMLTAASSAAGHLMVGHVMRCFPGIKRAHELVTTGGIGNLLDGYAARARLVHVPESARDWWKLDRSRTGGELLHEIHELDLLVWFFGEPAQVSCRPGAPDNVGVPTVHHTTLTFPSGSIAHHLVSTSAHRPEWSLRVSGTKAALDIDLREAVVTQYDDGAVVGRWDVFDDPAANASLKESAYQRQSYNASGAAGPLWMRAAVRCELDEVAAAVHAGTSVLLEHPATAVLAGLAALEQREPEAAR